MWLSVILSCWGAIKVLKPQPTKNKVGSSLSRLPPSPPFGAVSLDLCLPCYNLLWAVFLLSYCSSLVAKHRRASCKGSQLPHCRRGWACSAQQVLWSSVLSGLLRKGEWRAVFWGRGVGCACLFQHRYLHSQGHTFSSCSSGGQVDISEGPRGTLHAKVDQMAGLPDLALARDMVGRGLVPLLLTAFAPALLLPLPGNPSCSNERKELSLLTRCHWGCFLVGAILPFFLGPQKLTSEKLNRKLHFVSSTVTIIFLNTSKTRHCDNLGKVDSTRVWYLQVVPLMTYWAWKNLGSFYFFILQQLKWQNAERKERGWLYCVSFLSFAFE